MTKSTSSTSSTLISNARATGFAVSPMVAKKLAKLSVLELAIAQEGFDLFMGMSTVNWSVNQRAVAQFQELGDCVDLVFSSGVTTPSMLLHLYNAINAMRAAIRSCSLEHSKAKAA